MAAAVACARFSQNAWRREMCSNCFKAKTEHAPPPPRPQPPPPTAQPKNSILKGVGKRPEKRPQRTGVVFHKDEPEIIGHDGGDISSGDESDCDAPHNNDQPDVAIPELSDAEDKELQNLTRINTDFNSDNANLLKAAAPTPVATTAKVAPATRTAVPTTRSAAPSASAVSKTGGTKITVSITSASAKTAPPAPKCIPIVSVTPFGSKPTAVCAPTPKERVVVVERRPPLGHEASVPAPAATAPLTAPALVKLQAKEASIRSEPAVVKIEVPPKPAVEETTLSLISSDSGNDSQPSEDEAKKPPSPTPSPTPPAFLYHKDSVDLISPPQSPLLKAKSEERPIPIGKVASELIISSNTQNDDDDEVVNKKPTFEKRKKNGAKLSEARSSALIRRWTVGERVLIQPRRPIMDAPEIVPLNLHTSTKLEPRELAGEPDGEDSSSTTMDAKPQVAEEMFEEIILPEPEEKPDVNKEPEKPPTPPSSPLPDEDLPPKLPETPPPLLQTKTPPARPTSLPGASNARSSFLHSALLGRPQVPTKPTSLMLANITSPGRRHQTTPVAVAVPTPVTPTRVEEPPKAVYIQPKTPEPPRKPFEAFVEMIKPEKPAILSPRPKMGSYKKRQAPRPPNDEWPRDRTPSGDSHEELSRRDSITSADKSSLHGKKGAGRFSLRRLLRMGGKEERATSPESPLSLPSSPESPIRPEIIHPSNLDGRQVEVVSRMQQVDQSPTPPTTPSSPTSMNVPSNTPPARPKPPPPPRTMSLPQSPQQRPARPPPPQSVQLLQMREKATEQNPPQQEDSIYANLDSVKGRSNTATPSKPQRNGSIRENSPDQTSPGNEDGDYEMVNFKDGRTVKRRRSVILSSLEENYGAVVGANHRALAQLVAALSSTPLPSETTSVSVLCYAGECRHIDEKSLVLLQILMHLEKMEQAGTNTASLEQFKIIRPKDPALSEIGPRVEMTEEGGGTPSPLGSVGCRACLLLAPSETAAPTLLSCGELKRAVTLLEFRSWGPELGAEELEVALQRWLDLERATALQSLARSRSPHRLPVGQEMFVNFLINASAVALAQAAKLATAS